MRMGARDPCWGPSRSRVPTASGGTRWTAGSRTLDVAIEKECAKVGCEATEAVVFHMEHEAAAQLFADAPLTQRALLEPIGATTPAASLQRCGRTE